MPTPSTGRPSCADLWTSPTWGGTRRSVAPRHPLVRELVCPHQRPENGHDQFDVARVVAIMAVFIAKTTGRQNISMSLPVSARTTAALKKMCGHGVEPGAAAHLRR